MLKIKPKEKLEKIKCGIYKYRGYKIYKCGYHHPDHCVWWEAVNLKTGCADYHYTTLWEIIRDIDKDEAKEEIN